MNFIKEHFFYYIIPGTIFISSILFKANNFSFDVMDITVSLSNYSVSHILLLGYFFGVVVIEPLGRMLRILVYKVKREKLKNALPENVLNMENEKATNLMYISSMYSNIFVSFILILLYMIYKTKNFFVIYIVIALLFSLFKWIDSEISLGKIKIGENNEQQN